MGINGCFFAVSIVIGIPHIKRDKESYLVQTLNSLIGSLSEEEKQDCILVLFVAEVKCRSTFV